ncbi:MAG TPA: quinone oxidoreductase [Bradyrhizobium sp.]
MVYAIRLKEYGEPDVLSWEEVEVGRPATGQARIRQTAVGVNFMEVSQRRGRSPIPLTLPGGLGGEAAGVIEEIGEGVADLAVGDRVAYAGGGAGAYAQTRIVPAQVLVKLPDGLSDRQGAAMMLKGMTAQFLVRQISRAKAGDTVLFHAASSGVGFIACQWLKHLGVRVIGTVSSDEKAEAARAHGCDHVVVYTREDFVARVKEITGGMKLSVVFDSVGKDTFVKSLDCLEPCGLAILYGQASGPVGPFDLGLLASKGSLFVTRPTLTAYANTRTKLLATAHDLFEVVKSGAVKIEINQTYPLKDAADAHRAIEARRTTGSTVLMV